MKSKIIEHVFSIIFVSMIMIFLIIILQYKDRQSEEKKYSSINDYIQLPFFDIYDSFDKALFEDLINLFYPDEYNKNQSIIQALKSYQEDQFNKNIHTSYLQEKLSWKKFLQLLGMYSKFVFIYVLVMILTYYGVQTLGVWRFIQKKNAAQKESGKKKLTLFGRILLCLKTIAKGFAYVVLFSPAYVIAYTIRTEFKTDTVFFMILLGVISNGLLVMYAQKFYTFLLTESRKGYVETALVKNLHSLYTHKDVKYGIPLKALLSPNKKFTGHVFHHIFENAQHQYLPTIKEQASFLISGLIIIEMALNIHGHLSYEMLRQILYKNFDIVIIIILGIFYTVKCTEIFTDILIHRQSMKYENNRIC